MATNDSTNRNNRLQELSGSDYEIADGQPDIRGWDVKDEKGQDIGEVDELIFDVKSRKVRYMVVDLDDNDLNVDEKDVLIPIGLAQLDGKEDDVILPGVTATQLTALPEYDKDRLNPEMETSIRNVFAGAGAAGVALAAGNSHEDDFYNHDHFNEANLYNRRQGTETDATAIPIIEENLEVGKRTIETGGVRLRSKIVERPVEENISLREEHVNVERTPVDRPVTEADLGSIKEGVIEMTEQAEVPVVNKEARVVEEITISKEVKERNETIQDTVRKTEVDIDNLNRCDIQDSTSLNTGEKGRLD